MAALRAATRTLGLCPNNTGDSTTIAITFLIANLIAKKKIRIANLLFLDAN